ncbi:MFS general substrate transporter [Dothidotthia symphoricarpi CBS 119687]|uniref:MFS general substrate transporter n=1 Tax=Dothidotthia symphoricarpi CBS 119687 TaxID=1392245 RepID=A0A6A5ZZL8_9PLEO|nr:MFS general substrate transporter [Dothidotthia symphoricarpi CBS 119687]KAF2124990.1 MFS general substrate transporter [Dothidotthia symphoricarpi CBS 119687]
METPTTSDIEVKGEEKAPDDWKPEKKEWLIMLSLTFISLMVALDATILVTVLPEITRDLGGSAAEGFWTGTSYLLTSAIFQPVIASVSHLWGRQQLLLVSLTFFTVGTILCTVAHDFTVMLSGRCIQGVGGGGIITLTQVIFCDMVPLRVRPKYFSLVLLTWSIGTIFGPVIGGALVENVSWRWCFIINFPFCGIGFVVAIFFVRLNAVSQLSFAQKIERTDWVGATLFVGSMTSFLVGLSWGGIQHPWKSAATLAPIIVGLVGLVLFGGWQTVRKEHGLLPVRLFNSWSSVAAFYSALMNGFLVFCGLYYLPLYRMSVHGSSTTRAGIELFPVACFVIPGSILVSILTSRIGRWRWAIWIGWVITTVGCGLWILLDVHTRFVVYAVVIAVFGIGAGMVLTAVNVGIQAIAKTEDAAMAASMYGFFRSLGMPLGVAIAGTVFQNTMADRLSDHGLPTSIAQDSERYIFVLRTMADSDPQKIAILESYSKGVQAVFIMMAAISASALLFSGTIKKFSMNKELTTAYSAR